MKFQFNSARVLRRLSHRAAKIIRQQGGLSHLVRKANQKAANNRSSLFGIWTEFKVLLRMVKAFASREYNNVEISSIVVATAAMLYFLNPLDAIPDFLMGGLIDDGLVLSAVISRIREELKRFTLWEKRYGAKR